MVAIASAVLCALQLEALRHCMAHKASQACTTCLAGLQYHFPTVTTSDDTSCDALRTQICWDLESSWSDCACEGFCEMEVQDYYQCTLKCDEDLDCFDTKSKQKDENENEEPNAASSSSGRQRRQLQGPIQSFFDFILRLLNLIDIFNIIDRPPEANDDFVITFQNQPVRIDVLANDVEPDGEVISVARIVTQPENGEAVIGNCTNIVSPPVPAPAPNTPAPSPSAPSPAAPGSCVGSCGSTSTDCFCDCFCAGFGK